jgi:hypothetical protein
MPDMEKVKVDGNSVTLYQTASGRWSAQSGFGFTDGHESRGQAIAAIRAINRKEKREDKKRSSQYAIKYASDRQEYEATRQHCSACGVYVKSMAMHERTAKHKNAVAYANYSRHTRY